MKFVYFMTWLLYHIVLMVSTARIPSAWLKSKQWGNQLVIHDLSSESPVKITELQDNIFKQLIANVTTVELYTSITIIAPAAFAGLEDIVHLVFER